MVCDARGSHGFVAQGSGFTSVDVSGASLTRAFGINDRGWITGYYKATSDAAPQGFVWQAGRFILIPAPAAVRGIAPQGIDDSGDLAGYYESSDGAFHGFVATRDARPVFDGNDATFRM